MLIAAMLLVTSCLPTHSGTVRAQVAQRVTEACSAHRMAAPAQPSETAGPPVIVVECAPGFASARDRVLIYHRSGAAPSVEALSMPTWRDTLDTTDSIWVFESAVPGRASLIIDFRRDQTGAVATLFDDRSGAGGVPYLLRDGLPVLREQRPPTLRVTAPDGWWKRGDIINYNLDVEVDGPISASFSAEIFNASFRTDGTIDFRIRVRDTNRDGRPDWQTTRSYPALDHYSSVYRAFLIVSEIGDYPIHDYVLWPLLGIARSTAGASRAASQGFGYGVVKGYGASFPPIQVDWPGAQVVTVGEFVASHGGAHNWYIESFSPFGPNEGTYANFENPFAFYDLAGASDGYPDLAIRQEYFGPEDEYLAYGTQLPANRRASQFVRYSWDQDHDHRWDFKLDLLGRHVVEDVVRVGDVTVRTVPYRDYPTWITARRWDIASFVAAERAATWTSEGIYEQVVDNLKLRNSYLSGLTDAPPADVAHRLPVGMRGEYVIDANAQPFLYFSEIDRKVHLVGAQGGAWTLPDGELRYTNHGGPHINRWTLTRDGETVADLAFLFGQAVLSDQRGVHLKAVSLPAARFTTLPPVDGEGWSRLGRLIKEHEDETRAVDPTAMFERLPGVPVRLAGATARDFRATDTGFRFTLHAPDRDIGGSRDALWSAVVAPETVIDYRPGSGFTFRPTSPPQLRASLRIAGGDGRALAPVDLELIVTNDGTTDAKGIGFDFNASLGSQTDLIAQRSLDVPAGGSVTARLRWTPPTDGLWTIRATSETQAVVGSASATVGPAARASLASLVAAQQLGRVAVGTVLGVFLAAVGLAGWIAFLSAPGSATADRPR